MVLTLLRQNMTQYMIADLHGTSQPTVWRIYRHLLPIIEEAICLRAPGELADLADGRIVLPDGTDVPARRFAPAFTESYSGKLHRHGALGPGHGHPRRGPSRGLRAGGWPSS
ncbi:MAG: hypothetical protein QM638_22220 [Nocardioides sp.]